MFIIKSFSFICSFSIMFTLLLNESYMICFIFSLITLFLFKELKKSFKKNKIKTINMYSQNPYDDYRRNTYPSNPNDESDKEKKKTNKKNKKNKSNDSNLDCDLFDCWDCCD